MDILVGLLLFAGGALLAVWATERLLEGLVGLALIAELSTFVVGALLSGLEAENIAVGVAASHAGATAIALGSVLGGATFLVCAALGLGAMVAPLEVTLPRPFLLIGAAASVVVSACRPVLAHTDGGTGRCFASHAAIGWADQRCRASGGAQGDGAR